MRRLPTRVMNVLVGLVYLVGARTYRGVKQLLGIPSSGDGVILCYHAVPKRYARGFDWQMRTLQRYATVVAADFRGTVPTAQRYAAVTFDDGHQSVLENAIPILEALNIPCVIFFITGLFGQQAPWAGLEDYDVGDLYMTERDIGNLPAQLVTIGAHTISHPNMPLLKTNQRLLELEGARTRLEQLTGRSVQLFAFPFGLQNRESILDARRAKYSRVFSVQPKAAFRQPGEFVCGRVVVNPSDWKIEFVLKLLGAYAWRSPLFALRDWLRSLRGHADRLSVPDAESLSSEHQVYG